MVVIFRIGVKLKTIDQLLKPRSLYPIDAATRSNIVMTTKLQIK